MVDHPAPPPLAQLCTLLNLPVTTPVPDKLTVELLRAWKPLAEDLARAQAPQAEELAQHLVATASQWGDEATLALACWIAGNIYHDLDLMVAADQAYSQAHRLYETLGDTLNDARMSLGWVHVLGELAEYDRALACASHVEEILAASALVEDRRRLANLYGNRGIVYEQMHHLVDAMADYERRWRFFSALVDKDIHIVLDEAMTLNDIGMVQTLVGQYIEAEQVFLQALTLLEPFARDPLTWADVTRIYMNRAALAALRLNQSDAVRRAFQQAQQSRMRLNNEQQQRYFALLDILETQWLLHLGHWQEVDLARLCNVERLTLASGVALETDMTRLLLGQYALLSGVADQALRRFVQVEQETVSKSPRIVYLACLWQGRVLRQLALYPQAEAKLQQAIDLVEQTRGRLTTDEHRAGYLEDKLVAYQDLCTLYLEQGEWLAALAVTEQSKARTLTDAVATPAASSAGNLTPRHSLTVLFEMLAATLPADTLVLSYAVLHNQVWVFLLTNQGPILPPQRLADVLSRTELDGGLRRIQQVRLFAEQRETTRQEKLTQAQKPLALWYDHYVAPLQPWLKQFRRVLISPDGLLNALPFSCLLHRQSEHYFAETHELSIIPSLTLWSALVARQQVRLPLRQRRACILGNSTKEGVKGQLPRAVDEARAVAAHFVAPKVLLETEATCLCFLTEAPQADVIHIAAHGEYRMGEPAASFIELADRPLQVRDILGLRLPGSTVILSACESSKGHLSGNEMLGLVRAFLYVGAQTVVATYWPVDDDAAFSLMTRFTHEFCQSGSVIYALNQTQRHFLADKTQITAHPFYWGSSAIFGVDPQ